MDWINQLSSQSLGLGDSISGSGDELLARALASFLLILGMVLLRRAGRRLIRRDAELLSESQRRQLFYLRMGTNLLLAVGLGAIWLSEIQSMALSVTAVLVAIVIATKELLMCLAGFLVRTGSRSFSVGDWIEVNGVRGEVIDYSPLSTGLLELEGEVNGHAYTGRTVTIPNAWYLSHPVVNETFAKNYALHRFAITLEPSIDLASAREALREIAERLGQPHPEVASRYNALIERKMGADLPGPEPEVTVTTTDLCKVRFSVLLFCPTRQAVSIESEITAEFLQLVLSGRLAANPAAESEEKQGNARRTAAE